MSDPSKIGMMQGAFFVGRVELLRWLNDFLQLNYKKVEDVSNGAAFCQLMDYLYPGKVPLHRVNFEAKLEWENEKNFKILQGTFEKLHIDKNIEVGKLIKGKYQDNLEFFQWMHAFFLQCAPAGGADYDPVLRRHQAGARNKNIRGPTASAAATERAAPVRAARPAAGAGAPANSAAVSQLKDEIAQLNIAVATVEHERDFYFGKLRDIEILCQDSEAAKQDGFVEKITAIMYAPDEE